ncbi:acyl carrier protein [Bacteroidia bacterium]|nr:acyl carrier protein [Bacteroidia bacterium]
MEIEKFIDLLAEQFEETDRSLLTPETKFKDLEEWSSLLALSVIALADEEYDVALKGDDIRNATTIEDLFNTIKNKI